MRLEFLSDGGHVVRVRQVVADLPVQPLARGDLLRRRGAGHDPTDVSPARVEATTRAAKVEAFSP